MIKSKKDGGFMKFRYKLFGAFLLACSIQAGFQNDASAAELKNIKQTACNKNAATVTWKEVEDADFYKCTLTDEKDFNIVDDVNEAEYTFTGLSAGKSYQLQIMAYKGEELLAESSETYEVVTTPDITNYKVTQTDAGENYVTLTVQGAEGANYYIVTKTGADGEQVAACATKKTVKNIKVKDLKENKKYTYKVYAVRKSEGDFYAYNSKSYKKLSVKTINEKVPVEQFDNKKIDFDHDIYTFGIDNSSYLADGYELQLRTMDGTEKKRFTSKGLKNVLTVEDMIKGHFYKYRVRTYITCGDKNAYSKWSDDKYIGVVEQISVTISLKNAKITWKKAEGATGYKISVSTDGRNFYTSRTVSSSTSKVVLTRIGGYRIRTNKRYYFRVTPISKDGSKTIESDYRTETNVLLK